MAYRTNRGLGSRAFELNVTIRVALLALTSMLLGILLVATEYRATSFLVAVGLLLQIGGLLRVVQTTNRELSRFLTAIAHSDFQQSFSMTGLGTAFDELGAAFSQVLDRFRAARADKEQQADYLNVLVEHVPVALATVFPDGRVELLNNAARKLLGFDETNARLAEGGTLGDALRTLKAGEKRLIKVAGGPSAQQLTVQATQLSLGGETRTIVSLQNIGGELEATEVRAWHDLVRVLTHEMMNSLTPVSSLARTAQSLLHDLKGRLDDRPDLAEDLTDVAEAMDTVTRRAGGLLRFVERYRQFTQVPRPQIERVRLREVLDRLDRLMGTALAERGIRLETLVLPPSLEAGFDPDMLDQVLINLVKNAAEALGDKGERHIRVTAHLDDYGRIVLSVADNGPGIDPEVADKIFVPFFTTKREGSGVGLSLCRQILLAHGGTIGVGEAEGGGTVFTLRF